MARIKIVYRFIFLIGMIGLVGCGFPADQLSDTNTLAVVTLPPEPTNTPSPTSAPVSVDDPCRIAGQQQVIDAASAEYQAAATTDGDALEVLNDWVGSVTVTLAANCKPATAVTSDPQELETLLDDLKSGGYVIYLRHTHTDRSRGDDDVSLGKCDQQRILSEQGRDEALMMRHAYQQLDLPVSLLLSTQYCRTLETAVLAFGVPQVISRTDLHTTLPEWLATVPPEGTNTIIVAHIGTIRDRVGLDDTFEEGDAFVYRPLGDGRFEFVGRIGLYDWPTLAALNAER